MFFFSYRAPLVQTRQILGDTLDKIAWEKGGIFKKGCRAMTVEQPRGGMSVLRQARVDAVAIVSDFSLTCAWYCYFARGVRVLCLCLRLKFEGNWS